MAKIERDQVYGDFQAIERLNAETGLFRAECVRCGTSKRYKAESLLENPLHDCNDKIKSINVIRRQLVDTVESVDEDDDVISLFEMDVEVITELLNELDSMESDSARKFQLVTLKTLVDLIPLAEKEYRRQPKQSNAFSLNALISQVRELVTDLQAVEDRSMMVERILNKVIQPAFLSVTQAMIDSTYRLRRAIEDDISPKQVQKVVALFDEAMREQASAYQDVFYDARKRISEELE